jgi:hypothetical protein
MAPTVDDQVTERCSAALMSALVSNLCIHRRTDTGLNMLPLRFAHPAKDAH